MNISVDKSIWKQFPHAKIGIIIGHNINNLFTSNELARLLKNTEQNIRSTLTREITQIPKINDWRNAYQAFGCKPSKYHCSVEALLRRILKGKDLPVINPVVDIYNIISISQILPAGGGDLDQVDGDIKLTKAVGSEKFIMLGSSETTSISAGEVVYSDDKDVLCRAWNYRESSDGLPGLKAGAS